VGLLEAIAGGDKGPGFMIHLLAELVGWDVIIIVYQGSGARLGLGVIEMPVSPSAGAKGSISYSACFVL
jgi:hypothetical protein